MDLHIVLQGNDSYCYKTIVYTGIIIEATDGKVTLNFYDIGELYKILQDLSETDGG